MEIQYFGANCVKLSTKKASIMSDDNLSQLGQNSVTKADDIVLISNTSVLRRVKENKITIDKPGEYEVSDVSIHGIPARAHLDDETKQTAVIYKVIIDDVRIALLGHIYPELNEQQLEEIGTVDVLILPCGGNGYTLDAIGALKLIKKIEPKIVIPTNFADKAIKYPVPQKELQEVLKEWSMEPKETLPKLKLKSSEIAGDSTQLIVLTR